jgi:hypothetical protein
MSKFKIGDLVSHHDGRGVGMVMGSRKDTSNLTIGKCTKIKVKWFETPYDFQTHWYFPVFLRHSTRTDKICPSK